LAFVALASLLVSSAVAAQTTETRTAIVMINAPIYLRPDVTRTPLRVAAVNTSLKVLEDNADWLQVEFHDPQYGPRVGFIESKNVRINKPDLRPMDLSVRPTTAQETARVYDAPQEPVYRSQPPTAPRIPGMHSGPSGFAAAIGGVTFQSETSGLFGIEMGGTVGNIQIYGQVGHMLNTLPKSIQADLDSAAATLTRQTGVRWELDGKTPTTYYGGGVKFLVPTGGPVRPFVLGGVGAAHLNASIKELDLGEVTDDLIDAGYFSEDDLRADKFGFEAGGGVLFLLPGHLQIEGGYRFMKFFNSEINVSRVVIGFGGRF
jgi:opacity protein-like surface antigen